MDNNSTKTIHIKRGLDIKMNGGIARDTLVYQCDKYAIKPHDFKWITPKLTVEVGDVVKIGTPLFVSKNNPNLRFVSPISGIVDTIERGEKRAIQYISVVSDGKDESESVDFSDAKSLNRDAVIECMTRYGLWPFMRQRPYGCIADYTDNPKAVFISCFDSAPFAPDYNILMSGKWDDFYAGIDILKKITDCKINLCLNSKADNYDFEKTQGVEFYYFTGPHPAGNIGTQINYISPINKGEVVWYVSPQDLATIGIFFRTGKLDFSKTIAITGCENAHYLSIINGAAIRNDLDGSVSFETRVISGNVLSGKKIDGFCFVGFYDNQITIINEGGKRRILGWLAPNLDKWSHSHTFLTWLFSNKKYDFDTTLHGGKRAIFLPEVYEKVFPLDIMPTELLKACIAKDIEKMENLGIYEVVEEDFALCDVVCPSKIECQQIIYDALTMLKKES